MREIYIPLPYSSETTERNDILIEILVPLCACRVRKIFIVSTTTFGIFTNNLRTHTNHSPPIELWISSQWCSTSANSVANRPSARTNILSLIVSARVCRLSLQNSFVKYFPVYYKEKIQKSGERIPSRKGENCCKFLVHRCIRMTALRNRIETICADMVRCDKQTHF